MFPTYKAYGNSLKGSATRKLWLVSCHLTYDPILFFYVLLEQ